MSYGEAVTRDFTVLFTERITEEISTGVQRPKQECCFRLDVLADVNTDDPLRNDTSQYIAFIDYEVSFALLQVEKYNKLTGLWDGLFNPEFDNDAHGVWFPKFAAINAVTPPLPTFNNIGERLQGYHIDWKSMLVDYGEGTYRIRSFTTKNAPPGVNTYSEEYCLKQYTPRRAKNTVRFSGSLTGYRLNLEDESKATDFSPIKWDFQIRLPNAFFGLNTESLTKEYTEYIDGSLVWTKDETLDKYIFITGKYPEYLHLKLKYWYFKSDNLTVTDYNGDNPNTIVNLPVTRSGPYDPPYQKGYLRTKCEVEFQRASTIPNSKRC